MHYDKIYIDKIEIYRNFIQYDIEFKYYENNKLYENNQCYQGGVC